jgi:hypothetical protein
MLHKTRELLIKQRTMSVNALRGHLSEFGLVAAKGVHRLKDLIALAQAEDRLPEPARQATGILAAEIASLDARSEELETQIERASVTNPMSRLLDEIPAFGPMIASAMVAFHPDPHVFRAPSDLPASLGLTLRPAFERRKGEARRHHQERRPLPAQDAGGRQHVRRAGRSQIQGRARRMDRRDAGEKARARGRGRARQQARHNRLGDDDDRRELPHRALRQGLKIKPPQRKDSTHISEFGKPSRRDDRHGREPNAKDTPPAVTSAKLAAMIGTRAVGYHQGQRTKSAPRRPDI